jgi:xanthine/uracil/vitamin C permease (AzgA family)
MNRKDKRNILAGENFFATFLIIKKHFFKELNQELAKVKDIRQAKKTQYTPDIILFLVIMKNACTIKSMNEMSSTFNTEESIENISKALGVDLEELPHYDTINNYLKKLEVNQLEK